MTLKAYAVLEEDENTGGIVFAKSHTAARRVGASEFADGDIEGVTCYRVPWADEYSAKGDVPYLVMIEHGWHFECHGCGQRVDSDFEGEDEDDNPITLQPVEDERGFFCSEPCCVRHLRRIDEQKTWIMWTADLMSLLLRRRMPGAVQTDDRAHVFPTEEHGMWTAQEAIISFTFPGSKIGPASFRFDRQNLQPYALVCAGDLAAFEAWKAAGYPAQMSEKP